MVLKLVNRLLLIRGSATTRIRGKVSETGAEPARFHCTLRKLVHFKKGAHANDESLTKVVDFW